MAKLILTRDVPMSECHWLDRDMRAGEEVFRFQGVTYGCIGPEGVAVTADPDIGPFFELPSSALTQEGER